MEHPITYYTCPGYSDVLCPYRTGLHSNLPNPNDQKKISHIAQMSYQCWSIMVYHNNLNRIIYRIRSHTDKWLRDLGLLVRVEAFAFWSGSRWVIESFDHSSLVANWIQLRLEFSIKVILPLNIVKRIVKQWSNVSPWIWSY